MMRRSVVELNGTCSIVAKEECEEKIFLTGLKRKEICQVCISHYVIKYVIRILQFIFIEMV